MRRIILHLAAVLALVAATPAAQQPAATAAGPAHPHELSDFAAASLGQCQLALASVDDMASLIDESRRASDAARSRAPLDAATRAVTEVRLHLASCIDTLKLIPQTPGRRILRFTTTTATLLDVLCGVTMAPGAVPTATHNGQEYFFCSAADRDDFQKDPPRFLVQPHR